MTTVVQSTYAENMDPARAGMIHGSDYNSETGVVETAAGIGFGIAVSQGSEDRGVIIGGTSELFRGVAIRDVTLESAQSDKYAQYQNLGYMSRGMIWVAPSSAVAPGDPVYFVPSTGVLTDASGGNEVINGAAWRSSAAGTGDLALLQLSGFARSS